MPDKIYILCSGNGDLGDASLYPEGERSKEYVRTDAILQWVKEQEAKLECGISADAFQLALNMLKEKLKSL